MAVVGVVSETDGDVAEVVEVAIQRPVGGQHVGLEDVAQDVDAPSLRQVDPPAVGLQKEDSSVQFSGPHAPQGCVGPPPHTSVLRTDWYHYHGDRHACTDCPTPQGRPH